MVAVTAYCQEQKDFLATLFKPVSTTALSTVIQKYYL